MRFRFIKSSVHGNLTERARVAPIANPVLLNAVYILTLPLRLPFGWIHSIWGTSPHTVKALSCWFGADPQKPWV